MTINIKKLCVLLCLSASSAAYATTQFGVAFGDEKQNYTQAQITNGINIMFKNGIKLVRIYDQLGGQYQTFMNVAQNNNMKIIVGIPNGELATKLGSSDAASNFVSTYITPYKTIITTIIVGNEIGDFPISPSDEATYITNLLGALDKVSLKNKIIVSMALGGGHDMTGWCNLDDHLNPAFTALQAQDTAHRKMYLHAYPFYAARQYYPLPSLYGNLQTCYQHFTGDLAPKLPNATVGIGETGWPTAGEDGAPNHQPIPSPENPAGIAALNKFLHDIHAGAVADGSAPSEILFFEAFDEPKKSGASFEPHFGIFYDLGDNGGTHKGELKPGITLTDIFGTSSTKNLAPHSKKISALKLK